MESVSKAMQKLMAKFLYIVDVPCPECGGEMTAWKEKEEDPPRCAPVCMECGYKSLQKKEAVSTQKMYEDSLKQKGINYLRYSSIVTDKALWSCRLDNYREIDQETLHAKTVALSAVDKLVKGEDIHVIFSGKTGTGKSHLSMGILQEVLEKSNYDKRCLFINYRELLEQLKFAMNDEQARKAITGSLMTEIKIADVVVIDDMGAELGSIENQKPATSYNLDTLTSILEARQSKATIFTSNLTAVQIEKAYSDRVLSRMLKNSTGFAVKMATTNDKRVSVEI